MKSELLNTLIERGFVHQSTNLAGLDEFARHNKVSAYIGFDLTANSLHVGSLIQIMMLRWLHRLGHNPIVLFGEATTRIGDPTGKTTARPILTDDEITKNREGIVMVIDRLVGSLRPHLVQVTNGEWFSQSGPSYMDFLADYGRHFTINRMLTFDSVKKRLEEQDSMSFLEFNYMLMQAVDFLKLHQHRTHRCMLQIGGSDQWGNVVNGVELVRRIEHTEVYGLTTPLMTNTAGLKMGKTADGAIWLDPNKTSAFEFWQFWRNIEDAKVDEFLRLFTELPIDEIEHIERCGDINAAKKILATEVTSMVHGKATADHAALLAAGGAISSSSVSAAPVHVIQAIRFEEGITLAQILLDAGLVSSKNEASKLALNNGVKLNGNAITDVRQELPRKAFEDNNFMLSVGKKKMVSVRIVDQK